jgi:uncharacterized protein YdaU (DUF1376 family)
MSWVNALTSTDISDYLRDAYAFDAKTGRAYTQVMMRLRIFGSLPFNDKSLAAIASCTRAFWNKHAWPELQEFFDVRDGRLFHPEVTGLRRTGRAAAPEPEVSADTRRQEIARAAARARWGDRPGVGVVHEQDDASPMHASSMHDASNSHASKHDNSMPYASEMHAKIDASDASEASPEASDAYASPRAPSLSLSDSNFSESLENSRVLEGEREDARAHATDASDASMHAPTDASRHAPGTKLDRSKRSRPRPQDMPFPDDWKTSPEGEREARRWGYDPAELAQDFRHYYVGKGEVRANWDAVFLTWVRREADHDGKRRQGTMTMAVPGGKAEAPVALEAPSERPIVGTGPVAEGARVERSLKLALTPSIYQNWLSKTKFVGLEDGEVTLSLPTEFERDWVRKHYGDHLFRAWRAENSDVRRVNIVVAAPERRTADG